MNYDETRELWKMDQKYLEMFEMSYWRRMEKILWTDHVTNEEEMLRNVEERNILQTEKKTKQNKKLKKERLTELVTFCVGTVS